jgi:hypothetical protein
MARPALSVVFNHGFGPLAPEAPLDQQDAFVMAEWLRRTDANGTLAQFLMPELQPQERKTAEIEGWILGVA